MLPRKTLVILFGCLPALLVFLFAGLPALLAADAKGIDLGIAARDTVVVQGWPADLKMLFGNLVDNAIRYTPAGGQVDLSVAFAACGKTVQGSAQAGVLTLDLTTVPDSCRVDQPATLTLSMARGAAGSQAEIYLSSDPAEAQALAAPSVPAPMGALPSVDEGLVVPAFNKT